MIALALSAEEQRRLEAQAARMRLVLTLTGYLSRIVGSVAAMECARNAVGMAADGTVSLAVALTAAIHHRRTQPHYAADWAHVTDRMASEVVNVAACVTIAAEREAHGPLCMETACCMGTAKDDEAAR